MSLAVCMADIWAFSALEPRAKAPGRARQALVLARCRAAKQASMAGVRRQNSKIHHGGTEGPRAAAKPQFQFLASWWLKISPPRRQERLDWVVSRNLTSAVSLSPKEIGAGTSPAPGPSSCNLEG